MKLKYEWVSTLLIALAFALCAFIVVDIAYDVRIWESDSYTLKARLEALALIIFLFYFLNYIFRLIANRFTGKNKETTNWKEYGRVFLVSIILSNTAHAFTIFYINKWDSYRWGEAALINVVMILISFLYYGIIRNGILHKKFIDQNLQLEKVKVDQLETELKFLKSQYHPHFLFNALNTIYFQVDDENSEAKQSIEQLSDLLRYQLYDIEQEVTMEQEVSYLKSYIAFQQLRMSERLVLDIYFDPDLKGQIIHPLLFQPLIENAFKYVRGDYRIKLELKLVDNQIQFYTENSVSPSQNMDNRKDSGIGIENLKRRLELLYPNKYTLKIGQKDNLFWVELIITIS